MIYRILPPEEIIETTVELPLSKSETARSMVCRWLAGERDNFKGEDLCDDTRVLARGLRGIGTSPVIDLGASGTALRVLTALCAASEGVEVRLTGDDSLRARPMRELVDALRGMGADITYAVREGYAPLDIRGKRLGGGDVGISTDTSTQYATALLLAAPLMEKPVRLHLTGSGESTPYIEMTTCILADYGADTDYGRDEAVAGGRVRECDFTPGRDWSAAAFWYEIAALSAGWVTLSGLSEQTLQGDAGCRHIFEKLGVLTGEAQETEGLELSATPDLYGNVEEDLSAMPDCVPALAVTACLAGVRFRFSGVGALRYKECNRLEALIEELAKLGFVLETDKYDTELVWDGGRTPVFELPVLDTHNDHRMAMALAPAAIFVPGIRIRCAECVAKSYPGYWEHLRNAGFTVEDAGEGDAR